METLADVAEVLDPVLTRLGFAAGQDGGGGTDDSGDVIWCASFAMVHDRFPWLPQVTTQFDLSGYECFDLRVSLISGKIAEVDVEGLRLSETLRLCGRAEDADQAVELPGQPLATASRTLAAVVARLFDAPSTTQRPSQQR